MLTPMDIDRVEFKKVMRGYDIEEVDEFLAEINRSYEKLYIKHQEAVEQVSRLSDAVAQYKSMEETLQTALTVAKRDGDDMKKAAQEEADALLRNARIQAEEEMSRLSYQYEQMKHGVEVFRAKVVSLLHAQLDVIKEYGEGEPVPVPEITNEVVVETPEFSSEEQDTVVIPAISEEDSNE